MTTTPNGVPLLSADEQNPDLVVNQIALLVDTMRGPVVDRTLTAPPTTPNEDGVYIPAAGSTGAWAGKDNNLAKYFQNAWNFYPPKNGWKIYSLSDGSDIVFNGTVWLTV